MDTIDDCLTCARALHTMFVQTAHTLVTAESCTGGLIGKIITDIPGSSAYYQGGFITYSNHFKTILLNVPETLLKQYGAVSEQAAGAMAEGARAATNADYALAVTGIAGPDGGTPEKPVGLVYTALASRYHSTEHYKDIFTGNRQSIREQTACRALCRLTELIQQG